MNDAGRLAILEQRRAAHESVLVGSREWLVHNRPALASPFSRLLRGTPRVLPCRGSAI